jgi:hypothetical protein
MEDVRSAKDFSREGAEVVTAEFITFDGLKVITETSFNDGFYLLLFMLSLIHQPLKRRQAIYNN